MVISAAMELLARPNAEGSMQKAEHP